MRAVIAFDAAVFLVACGGEPPLPPATPAAPVANIKITKAPDSGKVDRVGAADGALKPDGINDHSFAVEADGPIKAIFLVAVDEAGTSNGRYQADTLVGDEEVPKAVA